MLNKISSRYSKAFYESLGSETKVRKSIEELKGFSEVMASHEDLKRVLSSELFTTKVRREVIEDLAKQLKLSSETLRLLLVLNTAHRLSSLKGIVEGLHHHLLNESDIVPLHVEAAVVLTDLEREAIEKKFSKLLGKKVEATYGERAELVGGVRVTAGSRTYDGSLSGGLSQIEEQLIGGSI